jgi:hypothetical protein
MKPASRRNVARHRPMFSEGNHVDVRLSEGIASQAADPLPYIEMHPYGAGGRMDPYLGGLDIAGGKGTVAESRCGGS